MNQTANNTENSNPEKLNPVKKEVRKKSKMENESLILVDILKAVDEVKIDGFGRVVIFIQNGQIYRWERIKTTTGKNLTSFDN